MYEDCVVRKNWNRGRIKNYADYWRVEEDSKAPLDKIKLYCEISELLNTVTVPYAVSLKQLPLPFCKDDADWYKQLHGKDCKAEQHDLEIALLILPPDELEEYGSEGADADEADDLEAKPHFGVGADKIGTDSSDDQDERSDEGSGEELARQVNLLDSSCPHVLNCICKFMDDTGIHANVLKIIIRILI